MHQLLHPSAEGGDERAVDEPEGAVQMLGQQRDADRCIDRSPPRRGGQSRVECRRGGDLERERSGSLELAVGRGKAVGDRIASGVVRVIRDPSDLAAWEKTEARFPSTFMNMYGLVVARPGEGVGAER